MAYNCKRQAQQNVYVRFGSYSGTEKAAPSVYGNMPQQPDAGRQGLSSVPQIDMTQNNAPPLIGDNRFSNAPPPNQMPHMQTMAPAERQTRVLEFRSQELNELLSNPKHHYTREGKPTKVCVKVYTDWCGPCRTLAPKFDEISMMPEYSDILFVSINGEQLSAEINKHIAVSAVPITFTFHCGRKINMIPGADVERIHAAVQELASYQGK